MGCSDDEFPWGRDSKDPLKNKYPYVVHGAKNAIANKVSTSHCLYVPHKQ